ncbi:uncharacterized protein LOC132742813 [Ruditapes philippinarum]|uniref:uncharacterized protein LOC132742813 n=1 Tax=Ruditapes philippinarum TaxID=129788 RepID=UPI00295B7744|nr:uncharacterized protein LOC132742813 [Ruditapes philippinarum]
MTTFLYIIGESSEDILHTASLVSNFQDGHFLPILVVYDSTSFEEVKVMYLYVGTESTKIKMYAEDKVLGLPGKVRIGGAFYPGYSCYLGKVTCFQFYDAKISSADYDIAVSRCMSTLWPSYIGVKTVEQCHSERGYFRLASNGKMPQLKVIPVASLYISTKVKCAHSCTLPSNACSSFAFNKLQNMCYLFDLDYTDSLVTETMADYYVTNDVGCCC